MSFNHISGTNTQSVISRHLNEPRTVDRQGSFELMNEPQLPPYTINRQTDPNFNHHGLTQRQIRSNTQDDDELMNITSFVNGSALEEEKYQHVGSENEEFYMQRR